MTTETLQAPDFEAMTLDELDAWNQQVNDRIQHFRHLYRLSNEPRARKVAALHLEEATNQLTAAAKASGRSLRDQAWHWLNEGAEDPGHRIQAGLWLRANEQKG